MKLFKKEPNIKFMKKRFLAFGISLLFIIAGGVKFFTTGFNLGIEFTGGTLLEVNYADDVSVNQIRKNLSDMGYGRSIIQKIAETTSRGDHKFFIKIIDPEILSENRDKERTLTKVKHKLKEEANRGMETGSRSDLNGLSENKLKTQLDEKGFTEEKIKAAIAKIRDQGIIKDYSELDGIEPGILEHIKSTTYLGKIKFEGSESIGPKVGKNLRSKAALAAVWALIGMLIYIAFRFKLVYGLAAVITLFHDVLISLSFILFFNVEVSLAVGAALLTIIGYSLNDTIVVFDRVRDNLSLTKGKGSAEIILDKSINQTLSRTIVTSLTTLLTMIALFLFGGEVLHWFAFTMIVGVVVGTFSSIFQSCSWLKIWEKHILLTSKKKKQ
jgi:preprotein translocase subunit SecF